MPLLVPRKEPWDYVICATVSAVTPLCRGTIYRASPSLGDRLFLAPLGNSGPGGAPFASYVFPAAFPANFPE